MRPTSHRSQSIGTSGRDALERLVAIAGMSTNARGFENFQVYGARKIWRQLKREGHDAARCTRFNNRRLLEPIGYIPPAEAEAAYYKAPESPPDLPPNSNQTASGESGAVHMAIRVPREFAQCIPLNYGGSTKGSL